MNYQLIPGGPKERISFNFFQFGNFNYSTLKMGEIQMKLSGNIRVYRWKEGVQFS